MTQQANNPYVIPAKAGPHTGHSQELGIQSPGPPTKTFGGDKRLCQNKGQTALILILLAAAALIFFAITINWGRIAQTKSLLSIAADQSASLLASDAASYGEMEKQEYLNNANRKSEIDWKIILDIVLIVIAIVICIFCPPAGGLLAAWLAGGLAAMTAVAMVVAVVMAVASLVLQLVLVTPTMERLWKESQQDQPIQQQFYEEGLGVGLMDAVTDQVNITDYFDLNTNGRYGVSRGTPNDTISRFSFFYTDRLKMQNTGELPQLVSFYNQLGQFMNGQTCAQDAINNKANPKVPLSAACPGDCLPSSTGLPSPDISCQSPVPAQETCAQNATDNHNYPCGAADPVCVPLNPACSLDILGVDCSASSPAAVCITTTVPNPLSFQLNDGCADSTFGSANYNPYCDPCCQPLSEANPGWNPNQPNNPLQPRYKAIRPYNCPAPAPTPPATCDPSKPSDPNCVPPGGECVTNNPYCPAGGAQCDYPYIYDPSYQEYSNANTNGASFLDQFGRDQQMGPFTSLKLQGNFPNGIFPFFWLMKNYSPEVDTIDPTKTNLDPSQYHWCVGGAPIGNGKSIPVFNNTTGFSDLDQLALPDYACQGKGCCVNYLANSVTNNAPTPPSGSTTNWVIDEAGSLSLANPYPADPAKDPRFGEAVPTPGPSTTNNPYALNTYVAPPPTEWLPGDNQMCLSTWPYNGSASVYPDGVCEWTGSSTAPASLIPAPQSTVDSLDDAIHTLSDFVTFSNNFLSKDVGTLNSTFSSWYPQVASWIAPGCSQLMCSQAESLAAGDPSLSSPACYVTGIDNGKACTPADDPNCVVQGTNSSCNGATPGRLLTVYNPAGNASPAVDRLNDWNSVISKWLANTYAPVAPASTATPAPPVWCLPSTTTGSTSEDYYINNNSGEPQSPANWGDMAHVIACLNYNGNPNSSSGGPLYFYQACLNQLPASGLCPATVPSACNPVYLGRTLATSDLVNGKPPAYPGANCAGSAYRKYVSDSVTLFTDEAPKFTARAQFLSDIYNRAKTMQTIFTQGDVALHSFFEPCASTDTACQHGGPAAKLIWARANGVGDPAKILPNAVIYGWKDNVPVGSGGCTDPDTGKKVGCAHIVKVTAYSPGRNGNAGFVAPLLPWINFFTSWEWCGIVGIPFDNYVLNNRDGYVYVSIKRWDQDHGPGVNFPNTHALWQFLFHNPSKPVSNSGPFFPSSCQGLGMPNAPNPIESIGWGLELNTVQGLLYTPAGSPKGSTAAQIMLQDQNALADAFMLNDNGNGQVDTSNLKSGKACLNDASVNSNYCQCLGWANAMLASGTESHACAEYIASKDASGPSQASEKPPTEGCETSFSPNPAENDYSLKFVSCNSVPGYNPSSPPEDNGMSY